MPHSVTASTTDSESASGGSNPSGATRQGALADVWCMRKTENLENVVQLHEAPQILGSAPAATRADCKSAVY